MVKSEVAVDLTSSESGTEPDRVFVGEYMLVLAFGDDENAIVGVCGTGNGRMTPSTYVKLALAVGENFHGLRDLLRTSQGEDAA